MKKKGIPFLTLAVVILASAFWIAVGSLVIDYAQHQDFLCFYLGGLAARQGELSRLYDVAFIAHLQDGLLHQKSNVDPFIRPPFYAALLAPLTLLPLAPAFWVWVSAQVAALLGCWWWLARRFGYDALIFAALYFPTSVGIYNGQDPIWMLTFFLGCYVLAEQKRDLASGAVLGLGMIKFHLLFLMPVAMIVERRWRMLAGFCTVGASAALLSLALSGTGIVGQYWALLHHRHEFQMMDVSPQLEISVGSIARNLGVDSAPLNVLLTVVVILLMAMAARQAPLWRWFSAACAGTLLVSPHAFRYDAGILLLPIMLAIFQSTNKFTRIVAATVAIPIPYMAAFFGPPYSGIPALLIFLFLVALAGENYSERTQGQMAPLETVVATPG